MASSRRSGSTTADATAVRELTETRSFALPASGRLDGRRVLLVYPPVRLSAPPLYPPFGLISIASVLERAGAHVEILDLNLRRCSFAEVQREIAARTFDVVGIGGMTTVYYYMKLLGRWLKTARPDVPVIGGGSACSASPRIVLEQAGFDVACVGEGEPVVVDIVDRLLRGADLADVPGIWYRDAAGVVHDNAARPRMANLEDLPLPAYHLIDMEAYIRNSQLYKHKLRGPMKQRVHELGIDPEKARRPVVLFTKRGCPFACNFCYRNFGRKVVASSIEHTLEHMSFLEQRYRTAHFVFGDEIFNIDKQWVLDFCERLIAEDRRYILATSNALRANLIDRRLLETMKRAGFCSIGIGIESFWDPTLKAMRKSQKAAQIREAIRLSHELGLMVNSAQLLFGYPTDGPEAMAANVAALDELGFDGANFSIPCPYPGTELYDVAVSRGLIPDEEGWLMELADKDISDRVINLSGMPDVELMALVARGRDEVRINALRRRRPVVGPLLAVVQRAGRRIAGIDALDLLHRAALALRHAWRPRAERPRAGRGDEAVREEAFRLLAGLPSLATDPAPPPPTAAPAAPGARRARPAALR